MEQLPSLDKIESERMWYRQLTSSDIDPWMEFHRSPEAIKHFKYGLDNRELCKTIIEAQIARYSRDNSGLRAVSLKGETEMIGMCGLLSQDVNGNKEVEIGYHFLPRYWGNGYASEAAIQHKKVAFEHSKLSCIVSLIHPENFPSQAVARRNGMSKQETATWKEQLVDVWRVQRPVT